MAVSTPNPAPPVAPPQIDEWRARDRFERDLLRQVRQTDWRAGREKIGVLKWNGVYLEVLVAEPR